MANIIHSASRRDMLKIAVLAGSSSMFGAVPGRVTRRIDSATRHA